MRIIIEMEQGTTMETVRWLATEFMRGHTDIVGVHIEGKEETEQEFEDRTKEGFMEAKELEMSPIRNKETGE